MKKLYRKMSLGLLTAGLAGGAALGLGSPAAPPLEVAPPKPDNPFISRARPLADPNLRPAVAVEPAVRQEPAVALEWSGPPSVKVREPGEYTLTVRNACAQPVQKVVVQVRVPKDATVSGTEPAAKPADGVLVWDVGTLEPKAAKPIRLTVATPHRGDLGCQAWVTFTGTAGMAVSVKEPKIAAQVVAPERVALGDPIPVTYVVRNVGDTKVDDVHYTLAEMGGGPPMPAGALELGREFRTATQNRAAAGGAVLYTLRATGSDGTEATASAKVHVMVPKLDVTMTGPVERVVGKKATFTMTVTNTGELPLDGVAVQSEIPPAFRLLGADGFVSGQAVASLGKAGTLAPGQSFTKSFDVIPVTPGQYRLTATATGSRDTKATADCRTTIDGIPAMRMEVIDLADPVEKGGETTYEIRITNTGSKADREVRLDCSWPAKLELVSVSGPTKDLVHLGDGHGSGPEAVITNSVMFSPIDELAPKTEAVYRLKMKAVAAGDVRFTASLTSKHLTTPVTKTESTRVFGE